MNKILVWDIPARLLHWAFAVSLSAALAIGFLVDDEQPLFQLHMLFGLVALFLVAVRLVMGVVGSRYSRFSSFPVHGGEVFGYLVSAVVAKTRRYAGNNPGSALAAVLMFLLVPALFFSGVGFNGKPLEDLHEVLAWGLAVVIGLHLLGLAWHTWRHRENIALSMITGRKEGDPAEAIRSSHPVWGAILLVGAGLWIGALFARHNSAQASVVLPGLGVTVQLGESESHRDGNKRDRRHRD